MSSRKIQKLQKIFTSSGGCGCGPKATDIVEPKSKTTFSDQKSSHYPSSSGSPGGAKPTVDDEECTSTTFSLNIDASPDGHFCRDHSKFPGTVSPCPKIQDSFAVVKDSDDPYHDFRQSMLQMIFEKELYSRNDLQQLLDCFLQLNSPHLHEVIVQAFIEIWNGGVPAAGGGWRAAEPPLCSSTRFT